MQRLIVAQMLMILAAGLWAGDNQQPAKAASVSTSAPDAAPAQKTAKKAKAKKRKEGAVTIIGESPNPGKTRIAVGGTFKIELPGNATTGYQWELKELDRSIAEPVGELEYRPAAAKPGMVGVGGISSFTIRGVKAGKITAVLVYRRSWEKDEPAKTFKVEISVADKK